MAKKVSKAAHGGRRKGSGRKPKFLEPIKVKGAKLPESLIAWAESQEGKTFSDVVYDALIAEKKRSEKRKRSSPPPD